MNPEFLEISHRIGARLCRDALWSGGRCNWTGQYREGETLAYAALGPQIYSGTSGIALFLWRLAEATGDRIIRLTALAALRQALSKMPQPGCGLYAGGLGILFAAAEIHGDCDEDTVVRQAEPDPSTLDVIGGSAGAIGVLVQLYRRRGGSRWLDAAIAHGDLLLAEAVRQEDGWSWDTLPGKPRNLTGFSHGTAGIGWALLELWSATGEARFRAAALEAFRYERSCFSPAVRNWPDFREEETAYPAVWCHGAGGIGFSRLRAWQILRDEESLAEARIAFGTIAGTLDSDGSFCLCHGIAGNADLLIYASQVLDEECWLTEAQTAGQRAAERYERRSIPWHCGLPDSNEMPGLMTGMAGIGYFYLRLADPASVPSVLIVGAPARRGSNASSLG
jgi:lantibiotic modifying enzyme